jgi:ribonuclease BN (tRNA processing enzyme)
MSYPSGARYAIFRRTCRERPGEVVTREELRSKLWPSDTFVDFDHSLNAAIKRLRDVLIHEAQPLELLAKMPESIQSFVAKYHTTTEQLAELANRAKPKLLVIYHTVSFPPGIAPPRLLPPKADAEALYASPEMLQKEIGSRYSGKFVVGKDLDVY